MRERNTLQAFPFNREEKVFRKTKQQRQSVINIAKPSERRPPSNLNLTEKETLSSFHLPSFALDLEIVALYSEIVFGLGDELHFSFNYKRCHLRDHLSAALFVKSCNDAREKHTKGVLINELNGLLQNFFNGDNIRV